MTQYEKEQFDKLKKQLTKLKEQQEVTTKELLVQQKVVRWMQREMRTGLRDIIERVVKETIEIDVVTSPPSLLSMDDLLTQELAKED